MMAGCSGQTAHAQCAGGMCGTNGGIIHGIGRAIFGASTYGSTYGQACVTPSTYGVMSGTYGYPVTSYSYAIPVYPVQTAVYYDMPIQTAWPASASVQTVAAPVRTASRVVYSSAREPFALDAPVRVAQTDRPTARSGVRRGTSDKRTVPGPTPVPARIADPPPDIRPLLGPEGPRPTARVVPAWMIDGEPPAVVVRPHAVPYPLGGLDPLRGLR